MKALPAVVTEIRAVVPAAPILLLFDRGGYSGTAFRWLSAQGIGFITYLKGRKARHHANAAIGRAYALLSQNLQGGSVPGETYMGSQGNWYAYSAAFAEAEERSPWQPLHVQKGFKPTDSAASVFFGGWYTHAGYGPRATWREKMRRCLSAAEHYSPPLLVLDPIAARGFAELGFDTKEQLIAWCARNARLPAREYWDNQHIQTLVHPLAVAGVEPYATRLKARPDEPIEIFEAKQIHVVVAGGETQGAWKLISGALHATVSIDAWR